MKKLLFFTLLIGVLGFTGYRALMNWTMDVNPASIARNMTPEQRSDACRALSGGTEGGYEVCMDGMSLAEQGVQNNVIPDLVQPATWAHYQSGYSIEQRQLWMSSFAKNGQAAFGGCLYDMLATAYPYSRFLEIQQSIQNGVDPTKISDFSLAYQDCQNGTFRSISGANTVTDSTVADATTNTSSPYASGTSKYWNAKCPDTLRYNMRLPLLKCDKGPGVQYIQQFLGVEADSFYGNDTFNAVVDFQEQNGLPITGTIDLATWKLLDTSRSAPGSDINGDGFVTPEEFGK